MTDQSQSRNSTVDHSELLWALDDLANEGDMLCRNAAEAIRGLIASRSERGLLLNLVQSVEHAELVLRETPVYKLPIFEIFPGLKRAYDKAMAAFPGEREDS